VGNEITVLNTNKVAPGTRDHWSQSLPFLRYNASAFSEHTIRSKCLWVQDLGFSVDNITKKVPDDRDYPKQFLAPH
jgi:hypothetical protein